MSRWHGSQCLDPRVEVEDGVPKCNSCDKAPPLAELIRDLRKNQSGLSLPPDESPSSLGLWWPRSVPYLVNAVRVAPSDDNLGANVSKHTLSQVFSKQPLHLSPAAAARPGMIKSSAYCRSIRPNEFRLAIVSGNNDYDSPIHLNLEIYDLDNCPEYETISYTWGGEDGDSTPRQPIYVGTHWDVLFQTKNCWDMLRFIRPQRGIRVVWVDAICINQNDMREQSSQVANMGRIYSGCTRVNVYLGPDISIPLGHRHPRRHSLHELVSGTVVPEFPRYTAPARRSTLKGLLQRRYFSRLWIVQELIQSCHILMRVGDVDFWADGSLSARLAADLPGWTWDHTAAPWLKYLAQGSFLRRSVWDLLILTSKSQAEDPRDRVFGLLGIAALREPESNGPESSDGSESDGSERSGPELDGPEESHQLVPNYSISCQHTFIGLFACWILVHRTPNVLFKAPISVRPVGYPSWAPYWKSPELWRSGFEIPQISPDEAWRYITRSGFNGYLRQRPRQIATYYLRASFHPPTSWNYGAFVCDATGALSLRLTQCLTLKAKPIRLSDKPVLLSKRYHYHLFTLRYHDLNSVYVFSEYLLDELATETDQVFVLDMNEHSLVYLILRPSTTAKGSFKLVATFPLLFIAGIRRFANQEISGQESDYIDVYGDDLLGLGLEKFQSSLYQHLGDITWLLSISREWRNGDDHPRSWLPEIYELRAAAEESDRWVERLVWSFFPHAECLRDLLLPFVGLFLFKELGNSNQSQRFEDAYLSCVRDGCEARVENGAVYLVLDAQSFSDKLWVEFVFPTESCIRPWEARSNKGGNWIVMDQYPERVDLSSGWVELRRPIYDLIRHFADANEMFEQLWFSLQVLHRVSSQTGEDIYDMIQRQPQENDRRVYCARWDKYGSHRHIFNDFALRDALGITGGFSTIRII